MVIERASRTLFVRSIERAATFYGVKLGFSLIFPAPASERLLVVICRGGEQLRFREGGDSILEVGPAGGTRWHAFIRVPDADAFAADLVAHKVPLVAPLSDMPGGLRGFEVADPDGHVLLFAHAKVRQAEALSPAISAAGYDPVKSMTPAVSLSMPVYNGANYIRVAIASCLEQDFTDLELIITDNASTDATEEICRDFASKDPRVRYVRNPNNLGAAPNYNLGFEMARGRYFKWCAHDDFISRDYLSATVAALEAAPAATLAFTRTQCVDEAGALISLIGAESAAIGDSNPAERFAQALTQMGTCYAIFGLFRTDALRKSTLHRPYYGSDRALLAELALLGAFVQTEQGLFFNREHRSRSVHLIKKAERRTWQAAGAARFAAAEHINFALHIMEIAGRHKQVVSPLEAQARAAIFAFQPRRIPRYAFELLTFGSPGFADFVKHKVLQQRDLAPVETSKPPSAQASV